MTDEPKGIEDPSKVDLVALSPQSDYVDLVMIQLTEWEPGSSRLVLLIQEKWKNYLAFAIDGQLAKTYPDLAHLPWRVVLACQTEPDDLTKEFVRRADEVTAQSGGRFVLRRLWEHE